jgi:hypothetical protein
MAGGQTSGTGGTVSNMLVYLIGWTIFFVLLITAVVAGHYLSRR